MKKIILEKVELPNITEFSPEQEKNKLESNASWNESKFATKILTLLDTGINNKTPKPVKVEGGQKSYTWAYKWYSSKLNKDIYLVYDSAMLELIDDKPTYKYLKLPNGKIATGLPASQEMVKHYDEILNTIGLKYNDEYLMDKLNNLFIYLQQLINTNNYRGKYFNDFNIALSNLYPTKPEFRLKGPNGETASKAQEVFMPDQFLTATQNEFDKTTKTLEQLGIPGIEIWERKGTSGLVAGREDERGQGGRDVQKCKTLLIQYLQFGIDNIGGITSDIQNICNMKGKIRLCDHMGSYDNLKISKDEIFTKTFPLKQSIKDKLYSKNKSGILGGLTRLFNQKLTYDEIVNMTRVDFKGDWDLSVPCKNVPTGGNKGTMMENHKKLKSRIHNILLETYLKKRYNRK